MLAGASKDVLAGVGRVCVQAGARKDVLAGVGRVCVQAGARKDVLAGGVQDLVLSIG